VLGSHTIVSGTLGGAGLHVCYYQRASEQLQLGVELETNFRTQESLTSLGYQVDLPKADLCFRGRYTRLNLITFWQKGHNVSLICSFKSSELVRIICVLAGGSLICVHAHKI
jgi:hypothetical protein